MNYIYRLVWNQASQRFVTATETARSRGKGASGKKSALGAGRLQGLAFFDYSSVNINAYPWPGAGNNSAQLAGAGVGLNWSTARNTRVKFSLATPVGSAPDSVSSPAKLRAWLELSAMF
jgi:hemolysin activation/secretion protein